MLKQTITYEDFDGNQCQETLYFNITKTELVNNLDLMEQFEALSTIFQGGSRDLEMEEIQQILNLVKRVINLSYGVKSEDGKRFMKKGLLDEFLDSAVYDAFLFSLFENVDKASQFLLGVFPKELIEAAKTQMDSPALRAITTDTETKTGGQIETVAAPTTKDLREMSHEELLAAFEAKNRQQD